ncbi:MAG: hypothetical protein HYZ54_02780, partial [Ignavibacteriae bacterium]|nr:hypothetical protein [Ignavibacteriota bacterium]
GLKYSYDFDNNGIFEIANSSSLAATVPASFLADGPATRTVHGRIIDKDGGFTDYTTLVAVNNVAPTASLSNNGPVSESGTATVSFASQADVAGADVAAGFKYSYDFDNNGEHHKPKKCCDANSEVEIFHVYLVNAAINSPAMSSIPNKK